MPPDQYRRALADLGFDKLRARFRNAISKHELPFHSIEFDSSRDIIGVIERMENKNKNGHAIVISGEIAAALDHPSEGVDEFHTYLEVEAETTRDGALGAEVCRNPEGFCRERTAWVFHQLARSLLKIGRRLKATGRPEAEYRQKFSQGLAHACSAIKLFKAHGFTDQVPSTRTVEKALWDELGKGPPQEPQPNTCLAPQT
jgi:hypothetical protein